MFVTEERGGVVLGATLPEQIREFMSDSCAPNIKISDYVKTEDGRGNNLTNSVKYRKLSITSNIQFFIKVNTVKESDTKL